MQNLDTAHKNLIIWRVLSFLGRCSLDLCLWTLPRKLFLGSSAVEQSAVNRLAAGSNPARGANQFCKPTFICFGFLLKGYSMTPPSFLVPGIVTLFMFLEK